MALKNLLQKFHLGGKKTEIPAEEGESMLLPPISVGDITVPPGGSIYHNEEAVAWIENERRVAIQEKLEKHFSRRVHGRDRSDKMKASANYQEGYENNMRKHPRLNSQIYDGTDSSLNPDPYLNPDAYLDFENRQRDQELQKKLALGLVPSPGKEFNPKPNGP